MNLFLAWWFTPTILGVVSKYQTWYREQTSTFIRFSEMEYFVYDQN